KCLRGHPGKEGQPMAGRENTVRTRTRQQPVSEQPLSAASAPGASLKLLAAPAPRPPEVPPCMRQDMIEQAAYFRAAQRGFEPGHERSEEHTSELQSH